MLRGNTAVRRDDVIGAIIGSAPLNSQTPPLASRRAGRLRETGLGHARPAGPRFLGSRGAGHPRVDARRAPGASWPARRASCR